MVSRIEHGGPGVTLTTTRGTVSADRVIVTVPLGVLKAGAVTFVPPLPEAKQRAVRRLGFGVLDKVVLAFDDAHWPAEPDMLGVVGADAPVTDLVNGLRFGETPLLIGLRGGANARTRSRSRRCAPRCACPVRKVRC